VTLWGAVDRIDRRLGFRDLEGVARWRAWRSRRSAFARRVRAARLERQAAFASSGALVVGSAAGAVALGAPGGLLLAAGGTAAAAAAVWGGRQITVPREREDAAPVWFPDVRRSSPAYVPLQRAVAARRVLDRVVAGGGPLALVAQDASLEGQRLVADVAARVATLDDHLAQVPGMLPRWSAARRTLVADLERAVAAYEELAGTVLVESYGPAGGSGWSVADPGPDAGGRIADFLARIDGVRAAGRSTRG
jgi:hypothetical protein